MLTCNKNLKGKASGECKKHCLYSLICLTTCYNGLNTV